MNEHPDTRDRRQPMKRGGNNDQMERASCSSDSEEAAPWPAKMAAYAATQPTLLDLSDDMLLNIFQYNSSMELKALAFTCTRLARLTRDRTLWKRVDAREVRVGNRRLDWFLDNGAHKGTTSFSITGLNGRLNQEHSNMPMSTLTCAKFMKIKLVCPTLTELRLEYCNLDFSSIHISEFPATLRLLSLRGTTFSADITEHKTFLHHMELHLPDLVHVDFSFCDWFEAASLMPLSKLTKLEVLIAVFCINLNECVAYASLATRYGFRALRRLDLRGCPIGDSEVMALGWLPNLQELHLERPNRSFNEQALLAVRDEQLYDWELQEPPYLELLRRNEMRAQVSEIMVPNCSKQDANNQPKEPKNDKENADGASGYSTPNVSNGEENTNSHQLCEKRVVGFCDKNERKTANDQENDKETNKTEQSIQMDIDENTYVSKKSKSSDPQSGMESSMSVDDKNPAVSDFNNEFNCSVENSVEEYNETNQYNDDYDIPDVDEIMKEIEDSDSEDDDLGPGPNDDKSDNNDASSEDDDDDTPKPKKPKLFKIRPGFMADVEHKRRSPPSYTIVANPFTNQNSQVSMLDLMDQFLPQGTVQPLASRSTENANNAARYQSNESNQSTSQATTSRANNSPPKENDNVVTSKHDISNSRLELTPSEDSAINEDMEEYCFDSDGSFDSVDENDEEIMRLDLESRPQMSYPRGVIEFSKKYEQEILNNVFKQPVEVSTSSGGNESRNDNNARPNDLILQPSTSSSSNRIIDPALNQPSTSSGLMRVNTTMNRQFDLLSQFNDQPSTSSGVVRFTRNNDSMPSTSSSEIQETSFTTRKNSDFLCSRASSFMKNNNNNNAGDIDNNNDIEPRFSYLDQPGPSGITKPEKPKISSDSSESSNFSDSESDDKEKPNNRTYVPSDSRKHDLCRLFYDFDSYENLPMEKDASGYIYRNYPESPGPIEIQPPQENQPSVENNSSNNNDAESIDKKDKIPVENKVDNVESEKEVSSVNENMKHENNPVEENHDIHHVYSNSEVKSVDEDSVSKPADDSSERKPVDGNSGCKTDENKCEIETKINEDNASSTNNTNETTDHVEAPGLPQQNIIGIHVMKAQSTETMGMINDLAIEKPIIPIKYLQKLPLPIHRPPTDCMSAIKRASEMYPPERVLRPLPFQNHIANILNTGRSAPIRADVPSTNPLIIKNINSVPVVTTNASANIDEGANTNQTVEKPNTPVRQNPEQPTNIPKRAKKKTRRGPRKSKKNLAAKSNAMVKSNPNDSQTFVNIQMNGPSSVETTVFTRFINKAGSSQFQYSFSSQTNDNINARYEQGTNSESNSEVISGSSENTTMSRRIRVDSNAAIHNQASATPTSNIKLISSPTNNGTFIRNPLGANMHIESSFKINSKTTAKPSPSNNENIITVQANANMHNEHIPINSNAPVKTSPTNNATYIKIRTNSDKHNESNSTTKSKTSAKSSQTGDSGYIKFQSTANTNVRNGRNYIAMYEGSVVLNPSGSDSPHIIINIGNGTNNRSNDITNGEVALSSNNVNENTNRKNDRPVSAATHVTVRFDAEIAATEERNYNANRRNEQNRTQNSQSGPSAHSSNMSAAGPSLVRDHMQALRNDDRQVVFVNLRSNSNRIVAMRDVNAMFLERPPNSQVDFDRRAIECFIDNMMRSRNYDIREEEANQLVTNAGILRLGRSQVGGKMITIGNYYVGPTSPNARPVVSPLRIFVCRGYTLVTNRSLEHLAVAAPNLRFLDVSSSGVTFQGIIQFQRLYPDCDVRHTCENRRLNENDSVDEADDEDELE